MYQHFWEPTTEVYILL